MSGDEAQSTSEGPRPQAPHETSTEVPQFPSTISQAKELLEHAIERLSKLTTFQLTSAAALAEAEHAGETARLYADWLGSKRVDDLVESITAGQPHVPVEDYADLNDALNDALNQHYVDNQDYVNLTAALNRAAGTPGRYSDGQVALEAVLQALREARETIRPLTGVTPPAIPAPTKVVEKGIPSVPNTFPVHFSPAAYAALEDLARQKHKSVAETLRDALALETWFQKTRDAGGKVLVERKGRLQELLKV